MSWTKEQQQAIDQEGSNIIVSAGAGSGKTAVLTARVQRKLLQGIHINELLILTFTNAAAQEMKERIRDTIRKTEGLEEQANLLEGSFITTFDSFSLSVVKKYHTRLNITNKIQVADEVFLKMQTKKILEEILEEQYLSPKKNFSSLIENFCLKDDEELKKYLLTSYQKMELKYDKADYLKNYFEWMSEEKLDSFIKEYLFLLKEKQRELQDAMDSLANYFEEDFIQKMKDNFHSLLEAKHYEDFLLGCGYKSLTVPRNSEEDGKNLKKTIFDLATEIKKLCIYESVEEMKEEVLSTYENTKVILEILQELDKRLTEYKFQNEMFGFQDISHLAIQLVLENEDIRQELTNQFQEILVDEYQDTSDTQELFLSLISKNNLYMVGDIKQSIYRFRNANPYIFKKKYDSYQDPKIGVRIDLLKNFRSRREVLENINLLFDLWMDDMFGGANYQKEHRMNFGNESYIHEGLTNQNYQMDIITYSKEDLVGVQPSEEEAFIIGYDIQKKVQEHFQVFDKSKGILRDIQYKDFVILLDKSKDFILYKKIFEYLHIPLTVLKEESLKAEDDILVIKNLLELLICIKEKRFDLDFRYAFTSVSRSFLYPTKDDIIYEYFVKDQFLSSSLYEKCLELSYRMDEMSLSAYFLFVMESFQYEEKLLTIGNIHYFRTRLEYLYRLCCDYEKMGKTIYDFVSYLKEVFEEDYDLKFNISSKESDSCQIMTIHKSKGLEFPICYFAGLSSKFNMQELKEKILFDPYYGFILPKVEESYKDTILKTLLKNHAKIEDISERIRLFYVALTRTKEKMIFVMPEQEELKETRGAVSVYEKENYSSFLSFMKSIYSLLLPFIQKTDVKATKKYLFKDSLVEFVHENKEKLEVEELSIPYQIIEKKHYSKENLSLITKEEKKLLTFGTEVHRVLEQIDFSNHHLDAYEMDSFVKEKIKAFLESDFMKDKLNMSIMKEYEFVDVQKDSVLHGIIDLLLEDQDKIILVDYKLKNIDDISYEKQLNGYRDFIQRKTGKKVLCYLYSILDENYREIAFF